MGLTDFLLSDERYGVPDVDAGPRGPWPGLLVPGNVDLRHRPRVKMPGGDVATVYSRTYDVGDGRAVLLPSVSDDGRLMGHADTFNEYLRTGRHLGIFSRQDTADAYAEALHKAQERFYMGSR